MKIILCDRKETQVLAWKNALINHPKRLDYTIEVVHGEIFQEDTKADVIVSPANSFGFMDGGIDLIYRNRFGMQMQKDLQNQIITYYNGEILVGQAEPVMLNDPVYKILISAPTMRIPNIILDYNDVYLATRAAMSVFSSYAMDSILFPGMGTGVGAVPPEIAATMMLKGIDEFFYPRPFPKSLGEMTARQNNSLVDTYRKMIEND